MHWPLINLAGLAWLLPPDSWTDTFTGPPQLPHSMTEDYQSHTPKSPFHTHHVAHMNSCLPFYHTALCVWEAARYMQLLPGFLYTN